MRLEVVEVAVWMVAFRPRCSRLAADEIFDGMQELVKKVLTLTNDLKPGSQYNYLMTLKQYLLFAGQKGVEDPLTFDLVVVKEFLSRYKATTRGSYAVRLRKIFEWNGEAADFKIRRVDNPLPEVLTEHEVNQLVKSARLLKWRVIFRLTYEGALRGHEVLGLKIKHVKFDKFGAEVFIPSTKSEQLWLRVITAAPLLQQWLEQHPDRENREAWLFPGCWKKSNKSTSEEEKNIRTSHAGFHLALVREARRLHIQKRVSPYILRHSRLAWLKKYGVKLGISDSVICKLYGRWSARNAHRMLDRYGKVDPAEANKIVLQAYGKLDQEQIMEPLVTPQDCPRCHSENDALSKYCRRCGMVLNEAEATQLMREEALAQKAFEVLVHPNVVTWLRELDSVLADPKKRRKYEALLEE